LEPFEINREAMLRRSSVGAGVFALLLIVAGFATGWFLSGQRDLPGEQTLSGPDATVTSAPVERPLPETDVPGSDLPELPRYPGSVMTEYEQKLYGDIMVTKADYLSNAGVEEVKSFYRDVFRDGGWRVNDVGFSQGEWEFFVVKGEREATIEIEPEDGLVEIEIEFSRPHNVGENGSPAGSEPSPGGSGGQSGSRDQGQPAPAQQAPVVVEDDDDLYEEEFDSDD
jgi:hypothetical protein